MPAAVRRPDSILRIDVSTRLAGVRRPADHTMPGSSLIAHAPWGSSSSALTASAAMPELAPGFRRADVCATW